MDAQRKIKWDDTAVDELIKQFDTDVADAESAPENAISQVLSSFKVRGRVLGVCLPVGLPSVV